jgi:chromosomal replication initiation ATPase DnaA
VSVSIIEDNITLVVWPKCQDYLQGELPQQQFNTWIRPLTASLGSNESILLWAPNRFIEGWVRDNFLERIIELVSYICSREVAIEIGVVANVPNFSRESLQREFSDNVRIDVEPRIREQK